jgi:hypothetical protein
MYDKIALAASIFFGMLWIRQRARQVDVSENPKKFLFGVYFLIFAFCFGEKYLFDTFVPNAWWKIPAQCLLLLASFALIGLTILRDKPTMPLSKAEEAH